LEQEKEKRNRAWERGNVSVGVTNPDQLRAKIINVTKQFNKVYHIQRISKLSCDAKALQTLLSTTSSVNSISYLVYYPELRLKKHKK
jgi:hypothetical protein